MGSKAMKEYQKGHGCTEFSSKREGNVKCPFWSYIFSFLNSFFLLEEEKELRKEKIEYLVNTGKFEGKRARDRQR